MNGHTLNSADCHIETKSIIHYILDLIKKKPEASFKLLKSCQHPFSCLNSHLTACFIKTKDSQEPSHPSSPDLQHICSPVPSHVYFPLGSEEKLPSFCFQISCFLLLIPPQIFHSSSLNISLPLFLRHSSHTIKIHIFSVQFSRF